MVRKPKKTVQAIVKVSQASYFKGFKFGALLGDCKCGEGLEVFLFDGLLPYRTICLKTEKGDTIETVAKVKEVL